MTDKVKHLKELVEGSDNIVFFGGAGVSTESGIPDFRSTGGLYHQEWRYPPEVILSHTFYAISKYFFWLARNSRVVTICIVLIYWFTLQK